jgi:hypothetical protein
MPNSMKVSAGVNTTLYRNLTQETVPGQRRKKQVVNTVSSPPEYLAVRPQRTVRALLWQVPQATCRDNTRPKWLELISVLVQRSQFLLLGGRVDELRF